MIFRSLRFHSRQVGWRLRILSNSREKFAFLTSQEFNNLTRFPRILYFIFLRNEIFEGGEDDEADGEEAYIDAYILQYLLPSDFLLDVGEIFLDASEEPALTVLILVVLAPMVEELSEDIHEGL